jgi:hypothetical protein
MLRDYIASEADGPLECNAQILVGTNSSWTLRTDRYADRIPQGRGSSPFANAVPLTSTKADSAAIIAVELSTSHLRIRDPKTKS